MPNFKYKPAGSPSPKGNRILFTVQLHPSASDQVNERAKHYNVSVSHYLWRLVCIGYLAESGQTLVADTTFNTQLKGINKLRSTWPAKVETDQSA